MRLRTESNAKGKLRLFLLDMGRYGRDDQNNPGPLEEF
jgi:hypothetical protein